MTVDKFLSYILLSTVVSTVTRMLV